MEKCNKQNSLKGFYKIPNKRTEKGVTKKLTHNNDLMACE